MEVGDAPLGLRKGAWTSEEDTLLKDYILKNGQGNWYLIPKRAGLNRCRKSCRLRWVNYLNPSIKKGPFEEDEIDLIIRLHKLLGNRWSLMAGRIPGRTANDVKNFWNSRMKKVIKSNSTNKIVDNSSMIHVPKRITQIRPRTHTFTKDLIFVKGKYVTRRTPDYMGGTINTNINQGRTTILEPTREEKGKEMENTIPHQKDISHEEGDVDNWQQTWSDAEVEQDGTDDLFDQITDCFDMIMLENINIWSLLED